MKTIEELRALIETKTTEVRGFLEGQKTEEAKAAMEELRGLKEQLKIAEELEAEELRGLQTQKNTNTGGVPAMPVDEMRAMTKYVLGHEMTDEERGVIKTVDNTAVIPKQFLNRLQELQKGFGSLKEYVDVITVTKNEGTFPLIDLDQNEMKEIAEGADIVDGELKTTDLPFKCKKVGLKQNLSSELIDDAEVEIEALCKKNFVNISVLKQNMGIVKIIKDNAEEFLDAIVVTDYKDIQNMIDSSLPSVKNGLVTFTNVSGFCYLKNLTDKEGRPLNLVTEMNGKYYFNGKELVVCDDAILPPVTEGKKIFYVANPKEAVKFMDRKATTIERWRKPENDTWNISILERWDICKGSTRSVKFLEI